MTPERLEAIRHAFELIVSRPPADHEDALARIGADDPELRREVEALLAARGRPHSLLDGNAASLLNAASTTEGRSLEGLAVGGYRLGRRIANGGMGTVFEAWRSDDVFAKRVAVKLCDIALVGDTTAERFRRERRILARLDHPNIARILDGGTTADGMPYFVMEFVDGLPLDRHVRERGLGLREVVRLMTEVCRAVDYAHRALVVHRDLKPSNVFVATDGTAKLLDFGIARLLVDDDGVPVTSTRTAHHPMTFAYAAPEQLQGGAVTIATDVYALGVLTYELLTGRRPCGDPDGSPFDNAKAIINDQPAPPSSVAGAAVPDDHVEGSRRLGLGAAQLARRLRGDLDRIVLKALEKSPDRRYASAAAFADDLDRYLEGKPVAAQRPSLAYRTRKFAGRHAWGVAAAVVLALSVSAGLAATVSQIRRADAAQREAERERARAEQRLTDVRRLVNTLLFDVQNAVGDLLGAEPARQMVSLRALEYLDRLAAEPAGDAALQTELAGEYDRVGDAAMSAGDAALALRTYRRAYDLRRRRAAQHSDPALELSLATSLARMGDAMYTDGRVAEALASYRASAEAGERLLQARPTDEAVGRRVIESHARLCERLARADGDADALASCQRAFAVADDIYNRAPDDRAAAESSMAAAVQLGARLRAMGRTDEARAVLASAERRAPRRPDADWSHDPHVGTWRRRPKLTDNRTGLMADTAAVLLRVEAVGDAGRFTYFNARQQPVLTITMAFDGKAVPVFNAKGVRIATISVRRIDRIRAESWGDGLPYIYERSTLSPDGRTWTSEARMKSANGQEYTDMDVWDRVQPPDAAAAGRPLRPTVPPAPDSKPN